MCDSWGESWDDCLGAAEPSDPWAAWDGLEVDDEMLDEDRLASAASAKATAATGRGRPPGTFGSKLARNAATLHRILNNSF